MNRDFLFTYILAIILLMALIIWKDVEPINYILGVSVAFTINIMALLYFSMESK